MLFSSLVVAGGRAETQTQTRTQGSSPTQTQTQSSHGCTSVAQPAPRNPGAQKKPSAKLDTSKQWTLTVKTSCGDFTVALDLKSAPNAAASMVALARAGFFKATSFHRIVPGFVIQGGDPTASGQGGPGYSTVDKPPADASYGPGVVAMAKTGAEAPGTAGSQFFVVTGTASQLPPDYAVLGKVKKGIEAVNRIGALGTQTEQPSQPVEIYDITAAGH